MLACKQGFPGLPKSLEEQPAFKAWKQSFYMLITTPSSLWKLAPPGFLFANKLFISSFKGMEGLWIIEELQCVLPELGERLCIFIFTVILGAKLGPVCTCGTEIWPEGRACKSWSWTVKPEWALTPEPACPPPAGHQSLDVLSLLFSKVCSQSRSSQYFRMACP